MEIYKRLLKAYGRQNWWPVNLKYHEETGGDWRVEVILGAILTQNTKWSNVEKAINNLMKEKVPFTVEFFANADINWLSDRIKPASFYRIKTSRIVNFFRHIFENHGSLDSFFDRPLEEVRSELLSLKGIGKETADAILLYAGNKLSFVVDAYTKRVFSRLGLIEENASYDEVKALFERNLPRDLEVYKEYHALIDEHAKRTCLKKNPRCEICPLKNLCKGKL